MQRLIVTFLLTLLADPLPTLNYVQPRCPPAVYPSKASPALLMPTPSPASPALVENDNNDDAPFSILPSWLVPDSSKMPSPDVNLSVLSNHLKGLTEAVNCHNSAPTLAASSSPLLWISTPRSNLLPTSPPVFPPFGFFHHDFQRDRTSSSPS